MNVLQPAPIAYKRVYCPEPVLPQYRSEHLESAIPAPEVTKIALKLRHLIELAVPHTHILVAIRFTSLPEE
ncbi:hypothetical protein CH063_13454 [Colletotrichum higginsianum]|uniref:Uncharacterized protein n=1 Tax=Colletotrichum higginsianum (strain IMI 349063) TaxID=759273 RepID=H1VUG3_COLHI|nr:hypothetical protein CH063_13454 [Colletotrichum higginsianum]